MTSILTYSSTLASPAHSMKVLRDLCVCVCVCVQTHIHRLLSLKRKMKFIIYDGLDSCKYEVISAGNSKGNHVISPCDDLFY